MAAEATERHHSPEVAWVVLKREGERGARIDPKGCKVRTTKDAQGNKRQYNKRGEEKITLKTTGNEMRLVVAGARQHSTVSQLVGVYCTVRGQTLQCFCDHNRSNEFR